MTETFINITDADTGDVWHVRPSDAVAYVGRASEGKTDILLACGSAFAIDNAAGTPLDLGFKFGAGYDGANGSCGVRSLAIRAIVAAEDGLNLHLSSGHIIMWPGGEAHLKQILDFAESSRPDV